MTADSKKIVWILGAGFSRGLGGPLFADIFRRGTLETLSFTFPKMRKELSSDMAKYIIYLYNFGTDFKYGPGLTDFELNFRHEQHESNGLNEKTINGTPGYGQHLWDDAEDFLKKLDECSNDVEIPLRSKISKILRLISTNPNKVSLDFKDMSACSKRLLASQCMAFLSRNDSNSEQWLPYLRWVRMLTENDTVITFNYDHVLERIHKDWDYSKLKVILPDLQLGQEGGVPVYKLHGSTDWGKKESDNGRIQVVLQDKEDFALTCPACELALGTPGPQKLLFSNELQSLWDSAVNALQVTDAVVFLGYRFPPTDAYARKQLLMEGLAKNKQDFIAVHTVLGPNTNNEDTARLKSLISNSVRRVDASVIRDFKSLRYKGYRLIAQPLYAQDFLEVANRDEIWDPKHS